ncbi:helix-turn-helix domain-containing protein [Actinokineospora sp.]|uniref:helix-turn-helix domain-containing protein n=1 Tax=Actinokineospora sp. TaxID=1872133 RepID=UPI0040380ADC
MASGGRTARRRRLGATLVALREKAGLTQRDAAAELDCSVGKIVNLERGDAAGKKAELETLLRFYGAAEDQFATLEVIRKEGAKRGWWSTYNLPEWAKPVVGFESEAVSARTFQPILIPGLLQVEHYSHALHTSARQLTPTADVDRHVAARKTRQQRLTSQLPYLELWAIIGEEALRRPVLSADGMANQLDHLVEMGKAPHVKIQVLPIAAGAHPAMSGSIYLMSYEDPEDPDIGWVEHPLGGFVVDDPKGVTTLSMIFDDIRAAALSVRDSARLIAKIAEEFREVRAHEEPARTRPVRLAKVQP